MSVKAWIEAARPRTLPLAFSSALMGSFAALNAGSFSSKVFLLALITTLFLQVLSNFANDYGDAASGLDHKNRVGPMRTVQSGLISPLAMKKAILLTSIAALVSGIWLILEGFTYQIHPMALIFLLLGLGAIAAAIKYTVGRNPYGYLGLGDVFVFVFFGPVGVAGTFFLHTHQLPKSILLPSCVVGFLSMAVLNINNMRDSRSDEAAGKRSVPVRLGLAKAKIYHAILILFALTALSVYTLIYMKGYLRILPLAFALPWFFVHLRTVWRTDEVVNLDPQLKKVALGTFFTTLLCGLAIWASSSLA